MVISRPSEEEFLLVREHFSVKARALADKTVFVDDNGQLVPKPAKTNFWGGFDISKFHKVIIDGDTFIVAAGNIIDGIVTDVLPEACQKYPNQFGTRDAHTVVKALFDTRPEVGYSNMTDYENHLAHEQFAMVFRILPNGTVDQRVLRLDLFRMIRPERGNPHQFEFIGGLMHALKHFLYKNVPLSTNRENYNLSHPTEIIGYIITAFFQQPLTQSNQGWNSTVPLDATHDLQCGFYEEAVVDVYFLNTAFVTST